MKRCYFCGESNPLVLESAHLIPRSIGHHVLKDSSGEIDVSRTIILCRNCHKKFESLLAPFLKYTKLSLDQREEEEEKETEPIELIGYLKDSVSGKPESFLKIYNDDYIADPYSLQHSPFATLRYGDTKIIDKALVLKRDKKFGKFIVRNGFVIDIIPMGVRQIEEPEDEELDPNLQIVLATLIEMEKETGMVEKSALVERLEKEHEITPNEAERLLGYMIKAGTIYSPREDYLKKA